MHTFIATIRLAVECCCFAVFYLKHVRKFCHEFVAKVRAIVG